MTTALALRRTTIDPAEWKMCMDIATQVADTEFVPKGLRRNKPAVLACMLYGRAIGLDPMIALAEISIIDGSPSMSANLISARIRDAGHKLWWETLDDGAGRVLGVTALGKRSDSGDEGQFTFTMQMAADAGLAGKRNWQQYPQSMCWARAVTQLARMLFSDVFLGASVYTPEELGSAGEPTGVVPALPAPASGEAPSPAADVAGEEGRGAETKSDAVASASPAASFTPGETTYPGGDFKDHAKPWLLEDDARRAITDALGDDVVNSALARWEVHRTDANAAQNTVRDCGEPGVLRLWADAEARTRGRKGVLTALERRLDELGGGPAMAPAGDPTAGESETGGSSGPPPAAEPLPETLQAASPLLRVRALIAFVAQQPQAVENPALWTNDGILAGVESSGWGRVSLLEALDDDQLEAIWSAVPADVRTYLEGLDLETLEKLARS